MNSKGIQGFLVVLLFALGIFFNATTAGFVFWFLSGLIVLVNGADYLVNGASNLASNLRVPPLIIGLTIVAFGTSLSELAVSAIASFYGNVGISVGNVVGSNILNIGLVLGITAIIYPLKVQNSTVKKETPFMILSGVIMIILCLNFLDFTPGLFVIGRIDGLMMFAIFIGFIYYLIKTTKRKKDFPIHLPRKHEKTWRLILLIIFGLAGILIGAQLLIQSSVGIARIYGISELIIGLTIVALGTSLPELATNISAALKKQHDIAVGNIVGSNISNTLLVLGVAAMIRPIPVDLSFMTLDITVMMVISLILMLFIFTKRELSRTEGIALVLFYAIYASYLMFSVMV
ncbi:MAG: calcium/sodium antiporter [Candidatus Aenigmarchaeota archaeon]|nr:calcium/sodium antiporter [Candidatus Aenigmarchaeota archaeon]